MSPVFIHSGTNALDLGPGAPPIWVHDGFVDSYALTTNSVGPLYRAPRLAKCDTCGAPNQPVGVKCHYCAVVVK